MVLLSKLLVFNSQIIVYDINLDSFSSLILFNKLDV